jgi:PIN domain nuclease of toxin-antitoxin system
VSAGYLLDTHIAILATAAPERLSSSIRSAVKRGPNVLSVITYWEVVLKSAKGKLDVGDPLAWWRMALEDLGATSLPLRPDHVAEVYSLAPTHQDPFDRALIAQAIVEGLTLATADEAMRSYAGERLRILR